MKFLVLLALLPLLASAEYTKLQWTNCGSPQVEFYNIDIQPMPIVQPGSAVFNFQARLKRPVSGKLNTELKIVRSVGAIALPIRCYLAAGVYVGSCTYDDLCAIVQQLLPDNFRPDICPAELAPFGIDCTCPFKIKAGDLNVDDVVLNLIDASTSAFTFLASGDFDINIKIKDAIGEYSCVNIKFTVKPAKL